MKSLTVILMMLFSLSSFADVTIIQSKINGTAVATDDKIINIMNPTIEVDGKEYALFGSEYEAVQSTGIYACEKLNMDFVALTAKRIFTVEVEILQVKQNGSMVFNDGLWSAITNLTCKLK